MSRSPDKGFDAPIDDPTKLYWPRPDFVRAPITVVRVPVPLERRQVSDKLRKTLPAASQIRRMPFYESSKKISKPSLADAHLEGDWPHLV